MVTEHTTPRNAFEAVILANGGRVFSAPKQGRWYECTDDVEWAATEAQREEDYAAAAAKRAEEKAAAGISYGDWCEERGYHTC